jgi:hypothetical protein
MLEPKAVDLGHERSDYEVTRVSLDPLCIRLGFRARGDDLIAEVVAELYERSPEHADALVAWVPTARSATEARNALVHAAWIMRSPTTDHAVGYRSRRGSGPRFDFRSREDFERVQADLRAAYDEGLRIR